MFRRRQRAQRTGPVGDTSLPSQQYGVFPDEGVVEVRHGVTQDGDDVWATVAEPGRWFVLYRGVSGHDGMISAQILWEVAPDTDLAALRRMRRQGRSQPDGFVRGYLDIDFYPDRATAAAAARRDQLRRGTGSSRHPGAVRR
jgi:hypothetical protein